MTEELLIFAALYLSGAVGAAWDIAYGELKVTTDWDNDGEKRSFWLEMLLVAFWPVIFVLFFLTVISRNSGE